MIDPPKYPNVTVKLIGEDGNAVGLIGIVARRIRLLVSEEAAAEFTNEAFDADSYTELLHLIQTTVVVE